MRRAKRRKVRYEQPFEKTDTVMMPTTSGPFPMPNGQFGGAPVAQQPSQVWVVPTAGNYAVVPGSGGYGLPQYQAMDEYGRIYTPIMKYGPQPCSAPVPVPIPTMNPQTAPITVPVNFENRSTSPLVAETSFVNNSPAPISVPMTTPVAPMIPQQFVAPQQLPPQQQNLDMKVNFVPQAGQEGLFNWISQNKGLSGD